jgi:nucleotide-binding universal stress UspA family protein
MVQTARLNLELLHVTNTEHDSDMDESIGNYLESMAIPFSYHKVVAEDTQKGILDFAHQKEGNILCLVAHHRSWFANLFHSSVSQQITLNSDLPVLVLPGREE